MSGAVSKANSRQNRNHAPQYKRYKEADRREVNKAKKLLRHLRDQPDDPVAKRTYEALSELVKKQAIRELNKTGAKYV